MRQILTIARKELNSYFSSPMALIFVGVFLAVTLFSFFWVDAFWARGTADVRPLFRAMPLLLIFLVAALTMRQWSEERQTGTLEVLLTLPVRGLQLVTGKFLAVLALVALALALTIFLPITVSSLGNLDWGPVIGGYIAALLLAASYTAIGLFVSSRTDNQIVSLILTALVCGFFHLIGTGAVTSIVPDDMARILRGLSTSARFQSIERGVLDLRDLLYYIALAVTFLALNILSLDAQRWGHGTQMRSYRRNALLTAALIALNAVVLNALIAPLNGIRLDLTENQEYTLSSATESVLQNLQEPLLVRGYFSEENHPLLAPLIPTIEDTLAEYRIASNGNLNVEIVDPITDAELEAEANQIYGITPTPLQTVDRSGSALINIYFDLLIRYGDQSTVLNFGDLIEIDQFGDGSVDVRLRNLEYDLTSAISRTVRGFQSIDSVFASLEEPATLTLYITSDTLPETIASAPQMIETIASDLAARSGGQFVFRVVDLNDPNNTVDPQQLFDRYQIQPIAASIFSPESYYLHMVIESGEDTQVIFPGGGLSETDIRTSIESALKRTTSGFLQVVGVWVPQNTPTQDPFGQPQPPPLAQYRLIQDTLREDYTVRTVDLSSGQVPADIDVLMVIAPQNMSQRERFAVDQYLMRGGSVFVSAGSYSLTQNPQDGSLALQPIEDGLRDLLAHYGADISDELVLDPQNEPFPIQVPRNVGGLTVNEVQTLNYPHFIDVRQEGMNRDSLVTSGLPTVTINWASPIALNNSEDITATPLLESSPQSWTTTSTNVIPDTVLYPENGFPVTGERASQLVGVTLEGSFTSYYTENEPPLASSEEPDPLATTGLLERSPASARLIVISSAEFLNDNVINLSASFNGDRYLNSLQLVQNSVMWFTQDEQLAAIRARSSETRLLQPITSEAQTRWEVINYGVALAVLALLGIIWRLNKRAEKPMELTPPHNEVATSGGKQP